jgi:hypothetical protein
VAGSVKSGISIVLAVSIVTDGHLHVGRRGASRIQTSLKPGGAVRSVRHVTLFCIQYPVCWWRASSPRATFSPSAWTGFVYYDDPRATCAGLGKAAAPIHRIRHSGMRQGRPVDAGDESFERDRCGQPGRRITGPFGADCLRASCGHRGCHVGQTGVICPLRCNRVSYSGIHLSRPRFNRPPSTVRTTSIRSALPLAEPIPNSGDQLCRSHDGGVAQLGEDLLQQHRRRRQRSGSLRRLPTR